MTKKILMTPKTKLVPTDTHTLEIRPNFRTGRIVLSARTSWKAFYMAEMTEQQALALQAAINDMLIELEVWKKREPS